MAESLIGWNTAEVSYFNANAFINVNYKTTFMISFVFARKMETRVILFGIFLLFSSSQAVLENEAETLVLLDNLAIRETHSIFFKSLTGEYIISAGIDFRV